MNNSNSRNAMLNSIMVLLLVFLLLISETGEAQIPKTIHYQGYLTDSLTADPINDTLEMTFSIYDEDSGGTPSWRETQTVVITDGRYSVQLGAVSPIDMTIAKPYWLGIQLGAEPELMPREAFSSSMYAIFAEQVEGITIQDGKVGIGTDDPQDELDVHGNAHIRGSLHVGPESIVIGPIKNFDDAGLEDVIFSEDGVIHFTDPKPENPGDDGKTDLVGIGSLSAEQLHVMEDISGGEITGGTINSSSYCLGDTCISHWSDLDCDSSNWNEAGGNVYRENGNVGIGTSSPQAVLDVAGSIKITEPEHDGSNPLLLFNATQNSILTDGFVIRYDHDFFGQQYEDALVFEKTDINDNNPDGGMAFVNTGKDGIVESSLVIRGNGNVGIGTNQPQERLHIVRESVPNAHYQEQASIYEAHEGKVQIISNDLGDSAAQLILTSAPENGENKHWGIHHTGVEWGDRLDFTYGTTDSSGNFWNNLPRKISFSPEGDLWLYGGKICFFDEDGATQTDNYYLEKTNNGDDNNRLRLVIQDNSDERFEIWGNGCSTPGGCSQNMQRTHFFQADGTTYHAGNVGIGRENIRAALDINGGIRAKRGFPENTDGSNVGYAFDANGDTGMFAVHGESDYKNDLYFVVDGEPRMVIRQYEHNGNVGIGTTTPRYKLHVNGSAAKPGGGSWSNASDIRLKDVMSTFTRGVDALKNLTPVHYRYKEDNPLDLPAENEYVGLIAQDVQKTIPEAVETDEQGYLSLNNDPIIWTMLNAIKELKAANDALQADNALLRQELEQVKELLTQ